VINHLLWNYYSDADLHAITQQIISQLAPLDMAEFSKWMIRGMNSTEIANWLRGVKNTAPKPLFSLLFSLAEQQLPANRWHLVRDALTEGAMVA
jgi:hypothetical protein